MKLPFRELWLGVQLEENRIPCRNPNSRCRLLRILPKGIQRDADRSRGQIAR